MTSESDSSSSDGGESIATIASNDSVSSSASTTSTSTRTNDDLILKLLNDIANLLDDSTNNGDIPQQSLNHLIVLLKGNDNLKGALKDTETESNDSLEGVLKNAEKESVSALEEGLHNLNLEPSPIDTLNDIALYLLTEFMNKDEDYQKFRYNWKGQFLNYNSSKDLIQFFKVTPVSMNDAYFTITKVNGRRQERIHFFQDELPISRKEIEDIFYDKFGTIMSRTKKIVHVINEKLFAPSTRSDETYDANLILNESSHNNWDQQRFATVINGESGSGKSAMMRNYFNTKKATRAKILITCDESDIEDSPPECQELYSAVMKRLFHHIVENNESRDFFQLLSRIHEEIYSSRNKNAMDKLDKLIWQSINTATSTDDNGMLISWFHGNENLIVEECYVMIDEIGKAQTFARGLVDSVRLLAEKWRTGHRCKYFRLIIGGSGIESFINEDSNDSKFYGTDPSKSAVVTLKGPNIQHEDFQNDLANFLYNQDIDRQIAKAILACTISRVFSTNSRMLFDGIIADILTQDAHLVTYESEKYERYLQICSSKVHMEVVPRTYLIMNGLINLSIAKRKQHISDAFQILVESHTMTASEGPQSDFRTYKEQNALSPNVKKVKQLGLIASDPMMTSPALRALICGGNVEELIGTDGRSFENVIGSHVELYFEHIVKASTGKHTLREAWPPHRTKKNESDEDNVSGTNQQETLDHLKERLSLNSKTDIIDVSKKIKEAMYTRTQSNRADVREIITKNVNASFALVLSQSNQQVQGPDVIVFHSRWNAQQDGINVDVYLYQAKHYKNSAFTTQDVTSLTNSNLVHSLGVHTHTTPYCKLSALYSKEGIHCFLYLLTTYMETELSLNAQFEIKKKILVVSETYDKELDDIYKAFHDDHGIAVWTRENLEPTISVFDEEEMSSSDEEADHNTYVGGKLKDCTSTTKND